MQLSYRGIKYEANDSNLPAIPGEVIGKYRGQSLRANQYALPPSTSTAILQYRGTLYVRG